MITVFAVLKAASTKEDLLLNALKEIIPFTRAEAGCIEYRVCQSVEDPCIFRVYEQFEDQQAFENHLASNHFAKLNAQAAELLCEEPVIDVCEEI